MNSSGLCPPKTESKEFICIECNKQEAIYCCIYTAALLCEGCYEENEIKYSVPESHLFLDLPKDPSNISKRIFQSMVSSSSKLWGHIKQIKAHKQGIMKNLNTCRRAFDTFIQGIIGDTYEGYRNIAAQYTESLLELETQIRHFCDPEILTKGGNYAPSSLSPTYQYVSLIERAERVCKEINHLDNKMQSRGEYVTNSIYSTQELVEGSLKTQIYVQISPNITYKFSDPRVMGTSNLICGEEQIIHLNTHFNYLYLFSLNSQTTRKLAILNKKSVRIINFSVHINKNIVLVSGGQKGEKYLNSCYMLTNSGIDEKTWSIRPYTLNPMRYGRIFHGIVSLEWKGDFTIYLVVGGRSSEGGTKRCEYLKFRHQLEITETDFYGKEAEGWAEGPPLAHIRESVSLCKFLKKQDYGIFAFGGMPVSAISEVSLLEMCTIGSLGPTAWKCIRIRRPFPVELERGLAGSLFTPTFLNTFLIAGGIYAENYKIKKERNCYFLNYIPDKEEAVIHRTTMQLPSAESFFNTQIIRDTISMSALGHFGHNVFIYNTRTKLWSQIMAHKWII